MKSLLWYLVAALSEIAGCFSFWAWLRLGRSPLWTVPGVVSLVGFALALTRIDAAAGRAYAAYGGIYILSSLLWLWLVEKNAPGSLGHNRGLHLPYRSCRYPVRPPQQLKR